MAQGGRNVFHAFDGGAQGSQRQQQRFRRGLPAAMEAIRIGALDAVKPGQRLQLMHGHDGALLYQFSFRAQARRGLRCGPP